MLGDGSDGQASRERMQEGHKLDGTIIKSYALPADKKLMVAHRVELLLLEETPTRLAKSTMLVSSARLDT